MVAIVWIPSVELLPPTLYARVLGAILELVLDERSAPQLHKNTKGWEILDDEYRLGVRNGFRIAKKTQTADFVHLPIPAAEVR